MSLVQDMLAVRPADRPSVDLVLLRVAKLSKAAGQGGGAAAAAGSATTEAAPLGNAGTLTPPPSWAPSASSAAGSAATKRSARDGDVLEAASARQSVDLGQLQGRTATPKDAASSQPGSATRPAISGGTGAGVGTPSSAASASRPPQRLPPPPIRHSSGEGRPFSTPPPPSVLNPTRAQQQGSVGEAALAAARGRIHSRYVVLRHGRGYQNTEVLQVLCVRVRACTCAHVRMSFRRGRRVERLTLGTGTIISSQTVRAATAQEWIRVFG
jgi:hypothetical protein